MSGRQPAYDRSLSTTAYQRVLDALGEHGSKVKANGVSATAQCPAHDDRNPSLSLHRIDGQALLYCHAGCGTADVLAALDLTLSALYDEPTGARYDYTDRAGTVLRTVHRTPDKRFRQTGQTKGIAQLYRLPSVVKAVADGTTVYVVEGEKDVLALEAIGAVATCSPMGAGKWHKVDPGPLTGAHVVVVPDRDSPGEKHARQVVESLDGLAASVQLALPTAGKDPADHVAAGHPLDDLVPAQLPTDEDEIAADDASDIGPEFDALGTRYRRSELAALPHVHDLVTGVLSEPAAIVLVGAYGTGKSVLVHGLAGAIATGNPWLGRAVEHRRALVVVGEGAYGLQDRIAAWEAASLGDQQIPDDQLEFLIKPGSLANLGTWNQLANYALATDARFIVLDTFSSLAPDVDETKDSAAVMRRLSDLSAAINGTVILVHHPGWGDAGRVRGGYQLEANADEVLVLTGVQGSDLVCLTRKKVKDGPDGATLWLRRVHSGNSVIFQHARPDDAAAPLRERILAALEGCGEVGVTGPQLQADCEVDDKSRSSFYRAIRGLVDDTTAASRGPRARARYYLTPLAPPETS